MISVFDDNYFMREAYNQAEIAFEKGEIPVGAVIVSENQIIAKAYNQTEMLNDFTAHAEMIAYTSASSYLGNKYLNECSLYVTLEPCIMCAGAAFWTRMKKVVFGAYDAKRGYSILANNVLHPKTEVIGGVMQNECEGILTEFFNNKR